MHFLKVNLSRMRSNNRVKLIEIQAYIIGAIMHAITNHHIQNNLLASLSFWHHCYSISHAALEYMKFLIKYMYMYSKVVSHEISTSIHQEKECYKHVHVTSIYLHCHAWLMWDIKKSMLSRQVNILKSTWLVRLFLRNRHWEGVKLHMY